MVVGSLGCGETGSPPKSSGFVNDNRGYFGGRGIARPPSSSHVRGGLLHRLRGLRRRKDWHRYLPPHNDEKFFGGRGTGPLPHNDREYIGGGGTGPPPHNVGKYLGGGGTGPPPQNSGAYVPTAPCFARRMVRSGLFHLIDLCCLAILILYVMSVWYH